MNKDNVVIYLENNNDVDLALEILNRYDQPIYHESLALTPIHERKRSYGVLSLLKSTSKDYWLAYGDDKKKFDLKYNDKHKINLSQLEELLKLENPIKVLDNKIEDLVKPKEDSIENLTLRLILAYKNQLGLKCKVTVEPFENSYNN